VFSVNRRVAWFESSPEEPTSLDANGHIRADTEGTSDESESGGTIACDKQVTKRILRNFIVVLALVGVALGTVACPEKGPAEKVGEKIDDAVDKTKDAVK